MPITNLVTRRGFLGTSAALLAFAMNPSQVRELENDQPQLTCIEKHKKLIWVEGDKDERLDGKICRAYIPKNPKGKPMYVLILGHVEELDWPSQYSGMIHFFERLKKEEKGTVLLFRTGLAADEIGAMLSPKYKPQYEPKTVFNNTKEILKGFIAECKPKEIRPAGFSWGAGIIAKLAKEDSGIQEVTVKRIVLIEPIAYGSFKFGTALRKRPEFNNSPPLMWIYQRNNKLSLLESLTTLQGNYPTKEVKDKNGEIKTIKDERPGDIIWQVPNTTHLDLDDISEIREKSYEFLISPR